MNFNGNGNENVNENVEKKAKVDKFPELARFVATLVRNKELKTFIPSLKKENNKGKKVLKKEGDIIDFNLRTVDGVNLELLLKKAIEYYNQPIVIRADKTYFAKLSKEMLELTFAIDKLKRANPEDPEIVTKKQELNDIRRQMGEVQSQQRTVVDDDNVKYAAQARQTLKILSQRSFASETISSAAKLYMMIQNTMAGREPDYVEPQCKQYDQEKWRPREDLGRAFGLQNHAEVHLNLPEHEKTFADTQDTWRKSECSVPQQRQIEHHVPKQRQTEHSVWRKSESSYVPPQQRGLELDNYGSNSEVNRDEKEIPAKNQTSVYVPPNRRNLQSFRASEKVNMFEAIASVDETQQIGVKQAKQVGVKQLQVKEVTPTPQVTIWGKFNRDALLAPIVSQKPSNVKSHTGSKFSPNKTYLHKDEDDEDDGGFFAEEFDKNCDAFEEGSFRSKRR